MQGYVLEVKNICLLLIFVDSNFIMAVFGWMLLYPVFLITQKRIVRPPKITISQTQMLRRPWASATLRIYPKLQRVM
jgi:hypothetical protein